MCDLSAIEEGGRGWRYRDSKTSFKKKLVEVELKIGYHGNNLYTYINILRTSPSLVSQYITISSLGFILTRTLTSPLSHPAILLSISMTTRPHFSGWSVSRCPIVVWSEGTRHCPADSRGDTPASWKFCARGGLEKESGRGESL